MKKVIPILAIIFSALCLVCSVIGIVAVSVSVGVPQLRILAVPVVIVGGVASALCTTFAAFFFKDKLCRIALCIDAGAVIISVASFIIWLAAL